MSANTEQKAPFDKLQWVVEPAGIDGRPQIAKVRDCYWDDICKEWVADLIFYSPDGVRVGRESPAMGGPKSFEPAVPVSKWRRIMRPKFPLERDRTGYRGWESALVYAGATL